MGGGLEFASGRTEVKGERSLRWQSRAQWPPLKHTLQVCSNLHGRIEQAPLLKRQHGSPGNSLYCIEARLDKYALITMVWDAATLKAPILMAI